MCWAITSRTRGSLYDEGELGQVWEKAMGSRAYWNRSQHLLSQVQIPPHGLLLPDPLPWPSQAPDTWTGACSMLMWTSTAEPSLWGKGKGSCSGRSQILRPPHFQFILWRPILFSCLRPLVDHRALQTPSKYWALGCYHNQNYPSPQKPPQVEHKLTGRLKVPTMT